MPAYTPVSNSTRFVVGDTIETEVFDLKMRVDGYTNVNLAMAVAQFANHLGGTLLVGAEEKAGRIGALREMNATDEAALRQRVSDAVEQCCAPKPIFECVPIPHQNGFLVGVNVEASLAGVVGVRIKTEKVDVGYGGASYVFPVRVGIAGGFITPDTMHNHMLPELRRTIILLRSIKKRDTIFVAGSGIESTRGTLDDLEVQEGSNRVVIEINTGSVSKKLYAPLPSVRLIHRDEKDVWCITVSHPI